MYSKCTTNVQQTANVQQQNIWPKNKTKLQKTDQFDRENRPTKRKPTNYWPTDTDVPAKPKKPTDQPYQPNCRLIVIEIEQRQTVRVCPSTEQRTGDIKPLRAGGQKGRALTKNMTILERQKLFHPRRVRGKFGRPMEIAKTVRASAPARAYRDDWGWRKDNLVGHDRRQPARQL